MSRDFSVFCGGKVVGGQKVIIVPKVVDKPDFMDLPL